MSSEPRPKQLLADSAGAKLVKQPGGFPHHRVPCVGIMLARNRAASATFCCCSAGGSAHGGAASQHLAFNMNVPSGSDAVTFFLKWCQDDVHCVCGAPRQRASSGEVIGSDSKWWCRLSSHRKTTRLDSKSSLSASQRVEVRSI